MCLQSYPGMKILVASTLFNHGFPLGEVDVALQISLQNSLLQDLNDAMEARLKWDSDARERYLDRERQVRKLGCFAAISVAPEDLQVQDAAAAGSTVQIRLLDLTHRHCLEKGAGMCKYNFLSIIFSKMLQLWPWAIFQSITRLVPHFPGT